MEPGEGEPHYTLAELEDVTKVQAGTKKIYVTLPNGRDFGERLASFNETVVEARAGDTEVFVDLTLGDGRQVTIRLPEQINMSGPVLERLVDLGGIKRSAAA